MSCKEMIPEHHHTRTEGFPCPWCQIDRLTERLVQYEPRGHTCCQRRSNGGVCQKPASVHNGGFWFCPICALIYKVHDDRGGR